MAQNEDEFIESGITTTLSTMFYEIVSSKLNLALLAICFYLLYKIFYKKHNEDDTPSSPFTQQLPPMKKKDMNYQELRKYDGTNEEGRLCVAVNGKIFDVTKGKHFYGPGGPYACFAGRDASRGLGTFSVDVHNEGYDDLSDLNSMEMEKVREWEVQFTERYQYVGRFLKPGEEPTDYSDDDDASQDQTNPDISAASPVKKEN